MRRVRCAIYTRKSSEEGLEQDFNSLHAQREACAAYVPSQASEGWVLSADAYDDGGISGGTLERPALKRLLGDIAEGRIDIVVVYKVDRLTRSLLDFSKLVEAFDQAEVSFVSIPQSFNTTTSMGRLTLNMLLSFAQFEREVTAERIRDKIAASKARGMWMGGVPPIGYAPHERTLRIVEGQAAFVRRLFARYLEPGTVGDLADELERQGATSPVRSYASGRSTGGGPFSRGQLYYLLSKPVYVGKIRHRDKTYPGQHQAIIEEATWDAVQTMLADNTQGTVRRRVSRPSLLAGLVRDENGHPLIASHACKGKVRYRYYINRSVHHGGQPTEGGTRVPAKDLEDAVTLAIAEALADPLELQLKLGVPLDVARLRGTAKAASVLAARVRAKDALVVRELVAAVHVGRSEVRVELRSAALAAAVGLASSDDQAILTLTKPAKLARTGMAVRMILADGRGAGEPEIKPSLVKLVVKAGQWWRQMAEGDFDREALAREHKVVPSYVSRVLRLAFLSPRVIEAILSGRHPARLDAEMLLAPGFPASWKAQERLFLAP